MTNSAPVGPTSAENLQAILEEVTGESINPQHLDKVLERLKPMKAMQALLNGDESAISGKTLKDISRRFQKVWEEITGAKLKLQHIQVAFSRGAQARDWQSFFGTAPKQPTKSTEEQTSQTPRFATLLHDSTDKHDEGCDCGLCDANGKSHGVSIMVLDEWLTKDKVDSTMMQFLTDPEYAHEYVNDVTQDDDPVAREFGCSEDAAEQNAKIEAEKLGIQIATFDDNCPLLAFLEKIADDHGLSLGGQDRDSYSDTQDRGNYCEDDDSLLKTEQNTPEMAKDVQSIAEAILQHTDCKPVPNFEHGQWWVTCLCGAQWSVVDIDSEEGFDLERVADGDDDYHRETDEPELCECGREWDECGARDEEEEDIHYDRGDEAARDEALYEDDEDAPRQCPDCDNMMDMAGNGEGSAWTACDSCGAVCDDCFAHVTVDSPIPGDVPQMCWSCYSRWLAVSATPEQFDVALQHHLDWEIQRKPHLFFKLYEVIVELGKERPEVAKLINPKKLDDFIDDVVRAGCQNWRITDTVPTPEHLRSVRLDGIRIAHGSQLRARHQINYQGGQTEDDCIRKGDIVTVKKVFVDGTVYLDEHDDRHLAWNLKNDFVPVR